MLNVYSIKELLQQSNWTIEIVVAKLIELDYICFPELCEETEGTLEHWIPIVKHFSDIWWVLLEEDKVIGSLSVLLLNEKGIKLTEQGEFSGGSFDTNILDLSNSICSKTGIFIDEVAIHPLYRKKGGLQLLLSEYKKWLSSKNNVQYAVGVTLVGQYLCEKYLGLISTKKAKVGLPGIVYKSL